MPGRQGDGTGDDRRERRHPDGAQRAAGQRLGEEGHGGGDRNRVRAERGDAGRRQRGPALEAQLQDDRARGVEADHGRRDHE
ncbi:MAG: hypothetical protein ACRDM1_10470, partial [Gaiellaceae bacterium]